ncbi:unnamed protein product [Psylliodes chrysocephalus]|uniref:DUF7083 domain-containing protein n=1 Tax=Psylliodes chrysocephalus TaxID=3402493 RepID=A0A9P0CGP2_9CUCU|nr:unnamed protein product [Psylliodes chrysocephala]
MDQFQAAFLQLVEQQRKFMEEMTKLAQPKSNTELIIESLASNIVEFVYDPDSGITFETWFSRYEDLFSEDAKVLTDSEKVRLLLRKLNTLAHSRYVNFILPKQPKEFNFIETINKLKTIFGRTMSLFHLRFKCLQLTKNPFDDFVTYAGIVNKYCENFNLKALDENQFKCLIFVSGLQSSLDADIRTILLAELNDPNKSINLEEIVSKCQQKLNLKQDTAMIENKTHSIETSTVNAVLNTSKSFTQKFPRQDKQVNNQECMSPEGGLKIYDVAL